MCLEKSTLIQYRLVHRGRDEVERAFEASSGGHRGKDIYHSVHAWNLSSHYIIGDTFHWQCYVFPYCMGSAHNTGMHADRRHSSHAN